MNAAYLRAMVDRELTDTCTIAGPGEPPVFDPDIGYETDPGGEVYDGPCRIRPAGPTEVTVGDAPVRFHGYLVTIPWDTVGVAVNQVVTITDSDDPDMIDRTFRVVLVGGGTGNPHRRLTVEQILDDTTEVGS